MVLKEGFKFSSISLIPRSLIDSLSNQEKLKRLCCMFALGRAQYGKSAGKQTFSKVKFLFKGKVSIFLSPKNDTVYPCEQHSKWLNSQLTFITSKLNTIIIYLSFSEKASGNSFRGLKNKLSSVNAAFNSFIIWSGTWCYNE